MHLFLYQYIHTIRKPRMILEPRTLFACNNLEKNGVARTDRVNPITLYIHRFAKSLLLNHKKSQLITIYSSNLAMSNAITI